MEGIPATLEAHSANVETSNSPIEGNALQNPTLGHCTEVFTGIFASQAISGRTGADIFFKH